MFPPSDDLDPRFRGGLTVLLAAIALFGPMSVVLASVSPIDRSISAAWAASERILVAVGPSPGSERLIRATKRIAEGLHAEWTAAHVEVLGGAPLPDKDRERIENHLRLAESLGADIVRLRLRREQL